MFPKFERAKGSCEETWFGFNEHNTSQEVLGSPRTQSANKAPAGSPTAIVYITRLRCARDIAGSLTEVWQNLLEIFAFADSSTINNGNNNKYYYNQQRE